MDVWAIIPVKSLLESKGRLAHLLSSGARARLVRNLLGHVLTTVQETSRITRALVVSGDSEVWQIAEGYDAQAVEEQMPYGLNSAVAQAYELAAEGGADAVLILPADLPFVTTADIDMMIDAGLGESGGNGTGAVTAMEFAPALAPAVDPAQTVMAICPDRRGDGTNALLLRPALEFDFHYGTNSLQRHIHEALDRDYVVRLVNAPRMQFDLDTEQDWQMYQGDEGSQPINNSVVRQLE